MISLSALSAVAFSAPLMVSLTVSAEPQPQTKPEELRARYVFSIDLDGDGADELLRVSAEQLSAHKVSGGELSPALWEVKGPGQAHLIKPWRSARGLSLLVLWGMGPGMLKAPLSLTELRPQSGEQRLLWRHEGSRSQAVHLDVTEQAGGAQIRLAHFTSKYQTRSVSLSGAVLSEAWAAQGPEALAATPKLKLNERVSRELRMGTSWAYADLDGDGQEEEVVGRVYGDKKGEFGELSLYRSAQPEPTVLPTERGVKAVYWARWGGDEGQGAIYFSDGWVAEYGKRAHARLKRLRWREGRPTVELLAASSDDFTFFELWTHPRPAATGEGRELLFARGNKGIYLITPQPEGPWGVERLSKLPPVVNSALLYAEGAWWVAIPAPRGPLRLERLTHPALPQ